MAWSLGVFLNRCNIPLASHRDFKPYPASAKMPRAFAPLFHSAKVRLRAPRSAQNDIQWGASQYISAKSSTSRKKTFVAHYTPINSLYPTFCKQKIPHGVPWGIERLFYIVKHFNVANFYDDAFVKILAFFK